MGDVDRLRGGILGALIGDAVGVPYEFHAPEHLPPMERLDLVPPEGFRRAHLGTPPGTWSDDGAHLLALLDSLLSCDRLDLEDLGQRLVSWERSGTYAVDGRVFDIGIQTGRALSAIAAGAPAATAGPDGEYDNGNGALMRVLPLALWHQGTDGELVHLAMEQGRPTHRHLRSAVCCAVYCLWARGTLRRRAAPFADAVARATAHLQHDPDALAELGVVLSFGAPKGTGYVVDSLHAARWACQADSYGAVVRRAISLGNDTDTTACIAGGIAGIRFGETGLPSRWRAGLRGRGLVDPLLERLEARARSLD